MTDEEESVFEIPKAEAEEQLAEEFEFEAEEEDQLIGDQRSEDRRQHRRQVEEL